MRKPLSLTVFCVCFFCCTNSVARACERVLMGGSLDPSLTVYFGADDEMPVNCNYLISVRDDFHVPKDRDDAATQIETAIPRWIFTALKKSSFDHECVVLVNDVAYFDLILDAVLERWSSESRQQEIAEILAPGAPDIGTAKNEFAEYVCNRIKNE